MISYRRLFIWVFVLIIFTAGLWQGFNLAFKKPLWTDELFSQASSVEGRAWLDIWTGGIREGNNSPMFYSIQKVISEVYGYKFEDLWHKEDVEARFILRIGPVVCMSLGLALMVWFFCVYYSWVGGLIAFVSAISSYMVWNYWAEARPYALMFLATTIQVFALLYYYRFDSKKRTWILAAANIFLALISSLSVIQIAASGVILWLKGTRRVAPLIWCVVLPLVIAFGYYMRAEHYLFWYASYGPPLSLIKANIPSARLMAFFILPVLIWVWDWKRKQGRECVLWPFFAWGWLTFLGYALFLGYLAFTQQPPTGFEISNRYLMSLTPVGVVVFTVAALELVQRPKTLWGKAIAWSAILATILPRLPKVWSWLTNGL